MKLAKTILKVLTANICLVAIFGLPNYSVAKYIVYAEYFFDTDPGQGNGHSVPACDGSLNEAEEEFCVNNISVPNLSEGRHTFFLRVEDSENKWGMRCQDFYVASSSPYVPKTIVEAEYFVNSDPGEGNGTPLQPVDGGFDESVEQVFGGGIESSSLPFGQCSLFVRVKDSYNVWGIPCKVNFNMIEASPYKIIDSAEYFIDTDPGVGLALQLTAADGAFNESLEEAFKNDLITASLSLGSHIVGVRFKDNWSYWPTFNGWGPLRLDTLCVCEKPALISPLNGSQGLYNQTFKWTPLLDVVSYQLQIDTTESLSNPIMDSSVIAETCFVTALPIGTPIWWRVRGNYPCEGAWSDIFEYTEVNDLIQDTNLSGSFSLFANYPNPFNAETIIDYTLPKNCNVKLIIYNILGQKVKLLIEEHQCAGYKSVTWNGRDDKNCQVSSGIYFFRIQADDFVETKKMVLIK